MTVPRLTGSVTAAAPTADATELLVLLPSLGTTTELWDGVVAALRPTLPAVRILRVDLPGHGASPAARDPFTIAELAEGVLRVVDEVGGGRFHVAGDSLGGVVALELAVAASARVASLTMLASGARIGTADGWAERAASVRASGTASLVGGSAQRWFAPGYLEREPDGPGGRALRLLVDVDDESYARCCEALGAFDRTAEAAGLAVPALLVAGEHDGVTTTEAMRALAAEVPGARFVELAGSAHLPPLDRPAEVAALIAEQVRSTDAATGDAATGDAATGCRDPRHGRAPRRARRRPRRRGRRGHHPRDRAVPGLHHPLRVGRDLGAPRPVAARALDRHAREPRHGRPRGRDPDARAGRAAQRARARRDHRGHPAHRAVRRPAGGQRRPRHRARGVHRRARPRRETRPMDKTYASAAEAVADIPDGASLAVGGFGLSGVPIVLIRALLERGTRDLEVVSNNCGVDGWGLGELLAAGRIRRVIASYIGENKEFARQYLGGEVEVELTPQGTLAERLRAGGVGIPAFYTATGAGTAVSDGGMPIRYAADGSVALASDPKELRPFDAFGRTREYVLERAIRTDVGLVRAAVGDRHGNLRFEKAARNFNPLAGMAGRFTIAEVDELVEPGVLDPDDIHLPGIYVDRVVVLSPEESADLPIEKVTTRPRKDA